MNRVLRSCQIPCAVLLLALPLLACANGSDRVGPKVQATAEKAVAAKPSAAKPQSVAPERSAREAVRALDKEAIAAIFDRQRALIEAALARVADSRPGVPEYFFIGFAGEAGEDVFLNEARAAEDVFRRRFGTGGRSLVLANNLRTAEQLPMATASTLELVLQGVGAKMGAEDVLILYVTSHGRPRRISVRYGRLALPSLRARELRRMLDAAGIRNRVVALSACYSGSFVPLLQNENTLIMTAAAHNRVSFGCGHDGTFTYFGQALVGDALERETSFARAFRRAERSIGQRETSEKRKPSKPQFFQGAKIGAAIDAVQRHLGPEPVTR
jgi:hypothetical protein